MRGTLHSARKAKSHYSDRAGAVGHKASNLAVSGSINQGRNLLIGSGFRSGVSGGAGHAGRVWNWAPCEECVERLLEPVGTTNVRSEEWLAHQPTQNVLQENDVRAGELDLQKPSTLVVLRPKTH